MALALALALAGMCELTGVYSLDKDLLDAGVRVVVVVRLMMGSSKRVRCK